MDDRRGNASKPCCTRPRTSSTQQVVAVDVVGTALVLDEFGKIVAEGGSGIVVASQAGHMMPPLSDEENQILARTPATELGSVDMLTSISDSSAAYGIAKRANVLRVQYDALA